MTVDRHDAMPGSDPALHGPQQALQQALVLHRQGQVEQAVFVLVDHAAVFFVGGEFLAPHPERRVEGLRFAFDEVARVVLLWPHDHGHAALDDAGFFARDLFQ